MEWWKMNYLKHKNKWKDCIECDLCTYRNKVVICKGVLPCNVLFVGDFPGASEDVLGKPFVGPAGTLLRQMIKNASDGYELTYAYTYLVRCAPRDRKGNTINPTKKQITVCKKGLQELINIAKPSLVVGIGKLLRKTAIDPSVKYRLVNILGPYSILGLDISQKGLAEQRATVELADAIEATFPNVLPFKED